MKKNEFVKAVAKAVVEDENTEESKVSLALAKSFVDAFCNTVIETLQNGEKVQLMGFGAFEPKKHAARVGHNPQTGKKIKIPARIAPHFTASTAFKDLLNE